MVDYFRDYCINCEDVYETGTCRGCDIYEITRINVRQTKLNYLSECFSNTIPSHTDEP